MMTADYQFITTMNMLTDAVRSLIPVSVPVPRVYDSSLYHSIEDFFHFFEKYCMATYGNDTSSWLQVLPDFLVGQSKLIVESFGISRSLEYGTVKARVVKEANVRSINDDYFSRIIGSARRENETLVCYYIRLEILTSKIPDLHPNIVHSLIQLNLFKSLPAQIVDRLKVQFGNLDTVSNELLVRVATILEAEIVPSEPPKTDCFSKVDLPLFTGKQRRVKCYRCGIIGHIRRNCNVELCKPSDWSSNRTCNSNGKAKFFRTPKRFYPPALTGSNSYAHPRSSYVRSPKQVDICAGSVKCTTSKSDKFFPSSSVAPVVNVLEDSKDWDDRYLNPSGLVVDGSVLVAEELSSGSGDVYPSPSDTSEIQIHGLANELDWDVLSHDGVDYICEPNDNNCKDSSSVCFDLCDIFETCDSELESGYSSTGSLVTDSNLCSEIKVRSFKNQFNSDFLAVEKRLNDSIRTIGSVFVV